MTDGIIQKVFNKWYKNKIERRRLQKIYWEDIKGIEQELIKEIEKALELAFTYQEIRRDLLGETKE